MDFFLWSHFMELDVHRKDCKTLDDGRWIHTVSGISTPFSHIAVGFLPVFCGTNHPVTGLKERQFG